MNLFLKILSGMANSVDPDQTAPSDLGLHCLHMPFCQKLWCSKFRTFTKPPVRKEVNISLSEVVLSPFPLRISIAFFVNICCSYLNTNIVNLFFL